MAFDKIVDSVALNSELKTLAGILREKSETTEELDFYAGDFSQTAESIETGADARAEINTLIDESGVLDNTEGTTTEKVRELIYTANLFYLTDRFQFGRNGPFPMESITVNCKNIGSLTKGFYNCNDLKSIYLSNTQNVSSWQNAFEGGEIETIETLDVSGATNNEISNKNWLQTSSLKNIKFVPQSIKKSVTFVNCSLLTIESTQSIAYGLAYVTTVQTLTLPKVFENDFVRLPAELRDLINTKGWTLVFA